jgi:hypothetical protein
MKLVVALALVAASAVALDPEMVCIGCAMLSSLGQEGAPVPWAKLSASCAGDRICESTVEKLASASVKGTLGESPDEVCVGMGLCDGTCQLYDPTYGPAWPPKAFPPAPPAWPVQSEKPLEDSPAKNLFVILEDLARAITGGRRLLCFLHRSAVRVICPRVRVQ